MSTTKNSLYRGGLPWILALSCLACLASFAAEARGQRAAMPNVVLIVADDIGPGDIQSMGGLIPTPNLDRLLSQGMNFIDANTYAAACHPTRWSIITGSNTYRSGSRNGFSEPSHNGLVFRGQRHRTLGEVMQAASYATSFIGKMHFGGPTLGQHGYDHVLGLPIGIQGSPSTIIDENAELITDDNGTPLSDGIFSKAEGGISLIGPMLAGSARSFIESNSDRPFFLHYNSQAIHGPQDPPQTFTTYDGTQVPVAGARDLTPQMAPLSAPAAMMLELDLQVGVILDTLQAEGVADNTLILFTDDNGPAFSLPALRHFMPRGHNSAGSIPDRNGELHGIRGGKLDSWEGGHRVPLIAKWGDGTAAGSMIQPGAVNGQLVSTNDIMATLYDLTGQAMEEDQARDSVSLLPTLFDASRNVRSSLYFQGGATPGGNLVGGWRMDDDEGEWVLLFRDREADHRGWFLIDDPDQLSAAEFYNLTDDPGQTNNLLTAHIQIDADEQPSPQGLATIQDPTLRQRVEDMIGQFFAVWEQDDPRTSPAVDYSIAANQTPFPVLRQRGDTNGDGLVDIDDLNFVRNNFGNMGAADGTLVGDAFPFDGLVNIDDLNGVRNNFSSAAAVPEPSAMMLTLLALAMLAARKAQWAAR